MTQTLTTPKKVALVHDYLNQLGGAERVVGTLHQMFPQAPIFTSIVDPDKLWPNMRSADIRPSWMQKLPGLKKHFKKYLPFFPSAFENLNLSDYNVIISSSSAWAKGTPTPPGAVHLCYCHTPMRFVWDYDRYVEREQLGTLMRVLLPPVIGFLKNWDLKTKHYPTHYIANSTVVKQRIKDYYNIDAHLIFPPVETSRYQPSEINGDYYLIVSRLNPYKRVDLAVQAFNQLGLKLIVVGDGPDRPVLQAMAKDNITFTGRLPDEAVEKLYAECKGFIFPGEEDFGIAPLEANACGRPVVAYKAGGALDTVVDGVTGVYFDEITPESLAQSVKKAEAIVWDKQVLRDNALRFSEEAFKTSLLNLIETAQPKPL
jgi:glycosyltransferase involved in cell wall biosynthesis